VPPEFEYVGNELELFAHAKNWKSYFRSQLSPFIQGNVLEVGAGLGGTTIVFQEDAFTTWTCLEPDQALLEQLKELLKATPASDRYRYEHGVLDQLDTNHRYDAILYIDVLEHIEADREEIQKAARLLKPGGRLIILSPAYQFLFSPFDARIGHFRRYTLKALKHITPDHCKIEKGFYLDSIGLFASLANRLFLKASLPTVRQIAFWDSVLVRCSRWMDWLVLHRVGRSVIIIWQKLAE
jgi:SAM-dependent methyltransferase